MRDPYRELAPLYDLMAADTGIQAIYAEFQASIREALKSHHVGPRVVVDLACGTGNTTVPWVAGSRRTVIGVDRSEGMLRVARRKSARVRWVRQDLERLRLDMQADVVTCHFDALNHVLGADDLQRVFVNVARLLRPGGLFQFDLNTLYFLRWLSTSEKLFRVGPHAFTAYNAFDSKSGVATFHQLWFVKQGRLFRKVEVSVRERAFDDADIRLMLRAAGLRLERVTVQRRLNGRPVRKVYLAAKPR
ncbi:MAG: class I SAM-dependent methyltransferase [Acidobacteria bacterium]|nr:class I SAM-dependent methyltransferase [Acidobacteriota bacterium]